MVIILVIPVICSSFYSIESLPEFNRGLNTEVSQTSMFPKNNIFLKEPNNLIDIKRCDQYLESSHNNEYNVHVPLWISGNDDFAEQVDSEGWFGNGTASSPYIIEKLEITGGTFQIRIEHTNVYFEIRHCLLLNGADHGIYLLNVTHGMIRSTSILDITDNPVFMSSCSFINVSNCVFTNSSMGGGVSIHSSTNIRISDNYCELLKIYVSSSSNKVVIMNNEIVGAYRGIAIDGGSFDVRVHANVARYNDIGISISGSNINLTENYVCDNLNQGFFGNAMDNNFSRNIVTNNSIGIHLSGGQRGVICENYIYNNSNDGLGVYESHYCLISGNAIAFNNGHGIRLESSFCTVVENFLFQNNQYGLHAGESDHYIYHNNFVSNNEGGVQAYNSISPDNHWDNDSEGNYWNDWTSPDAEGDGIVDSPYILDGSGAVTDYYPLTDLYPIFWNAHISLFPTPTSILAPFQQVNATILHPYLQSALYSWNDTSFQNLTGSSSLFAPGAEGYYELTILLTDVFGWSTFKCYSFIINSFPRITPSISFNGSIVTSGTFLSVNFTDNIGGLHWIWFQWDNQNIQVIANSGYYTFSTFQYDSFLVPSTEGQHYLTISVNDTYGFVNVISLEIYVDVTPPMIILKNPQNNTIIDNAVIIDLEINDYSLNSVWFNWITLNTNNQTSESPWDLAVPTEEGYHWLVVYANDSVGHIAVQKYQWYITVLSPSTSTEHFTTSQKILTSSNKSTPVITPSFQIIPLIIGLIVIIVLFNRSRR
ncbi:MAG: nitrous oxide reductase family maturation protein NosD [Promethearchaeota archaeon]